MRTFVNVRNLEFLLYEVFDAEQLIGFDYYSHHNRRLFDLVLKESVKLAKDLYAPSFEEMDRKPPELVAGTVKVHPDVKKIMLETGKGGWLSATFPKEFDGDQLPESISSCLRFIFSSANYSGSVYPLLTEAAARLITSFGTDDLVKTYVPDMLAGRWQGTMALTEPQAGSSLSDITTMACPNGDGTYTIKGRKIFISAGDHDGVENIIHLMLAKVVNAPAGVKGISLFVVPKLIEKEGAFVANDVIVSQIYHKMGYRGAPITELAIGDKDSCTGFLLGEENQGLSYMFQMMNEARLGVGIGACAIASSAFHTALEYCRQRPQGRPLSLKDPLKPQVPIIFHADVKRMLLFQKSVVEGALSLILQCSLYTDLAKTADQKTAEKYHLLLDILTPVAKSYPSEMGILSTSAAVQCLGGYGYCEDFPVEQHFRDMRIHPIHEGTTGIQGIDLLGRKVAMKDQAAFKQYIKTVGDIIDHARTIPLLAIYADRLQHALDALTGVTIHKLNLAVTDSAEVFLADATLYLDMFSIVTIAWQWLQQAIHAEKALSKKLTQKERRFYMGKRHAFRYFFGYELPKITGLEARLLDEDQVTLEMEPDYF